VAQQAQLGRDLRRAPRQVLPRHPPSKAHTSRASDGRPGRSPRDFHRPGSPDEKQALLNLRDASDAPLDLGSIALMMLSSPQYRANAVGSEA
jgi:hypothetical protein